MIRDSATTPQMTRVPTKGFPEKRGQNGEKSSNKGEGEREKRSKLKKDLSSWIRSKALPRACQK